MNAVTSPIKPSTLPIESKQAITGNQPTVLADIYQDDTNIVIWQRSLTKTLAQAADEIIQAKPKLQISCSVTPKNAYSSLSDLLNGSQLTAALLEDMTELIDMFCYLFDLKRAGLRLATLDRAMCPRFHVDQVPCRLVTTYRGTATQWLAHHQVDRTKLGAGNQGQPDEVSGLFKDIADINQLREGNVALLKGERWQGNEGAGLVHRSPQLEKNTRRLLLTLDFISD